MPRRFSVTNICSHPHRTETALPRARRHALGAVRLRRMQRIAAAALRGPRGALAVALALLAGGGAAVASRVADRGAAHETSARTVTVSSEQARRLPHESVDVGRVPHGRRRPAGFLSMSLQYRTVGQWGRTVSPVLVQLVDLLDPAGGEILRLGGQGGDRVWWPVPD